MLKIIIDPEKKTSYTKLLKMIIDKEAYVVVVRLAHTPNNLHITYSKRRGGTIRAIEEYNAAEELITGCSFKGRSSECLAGGDWIKELKADISTMKAQDWINNDCWIDEYSK